MKARAIPSLGRPAVAAALLLLSAGGLLRGQERNAEEVPVPKGVTKTAARGGFVAAPVVYYSPETHLAYGIVGIHYFRFGRSARPSRLSHYRFNVVHTQNKQTIAQLDFELYLSGGRLLLDGQAKYSYYPDRFYGIGDRTPEEAREDFTSRNLRLQLNVERRWGDSIFAGLHLETYSISMRSVESSGELASGAVPGSGGGRLTALGILAKWDNRDNTFSPGRGLYGALALNHFLRWLGGDFSFGQLTVDLRRYWPLGKTTVLAAQGVLRTVWGDCPFQMLPMFGGLNLLRGYYDGRYRDRGMLALQAECRLPLAGRFGISGFAGAAQVQPSLAKMALNGFHAAGGMGLRYKFNRRENLNVRLDAGFAGSTPAFYLTFAEAF
jgi:hypothetical protein